MATGGFVKIYRDIRDHWIYKDPDHFKAWFEMLSNARYIKEPKTDTYEGVFYTLNYGEFIFGRLSWSKRLGISEQKLRTLMKKLQSEGMIKATSRLSKLTVYKVVNYEKFNQQDNQHETIGAEGFQEDDNQQNDQQLTGSQPADNQQLTTNKESKEREEGEKGKENINDVFESLWKLYPRKEGKGKISKTQKEKLAKIGVEELTRAIERYKKSKEGVDKQYIQHGSTFFNSGYVDYLDDNYQEKEDQSNGESCSDRGNTQSRRKPWEPISDDDKIFFGQSF